MINPSLYFSRISSVDARLAVKALQEGGGDQLAEVAVALLVLDQHQQMEIVAVLVAAVTLVQARLGRQVELGADDRLDVGLARLLEKVDRSQDGAVVGQGHGRHLECCRLFYQIVEFLGWNRAG